MFYVQYAINGSLPDYKIFPTEDLMDQWENSLEGLDILDRGDFLSWQTEHTVSVEEIETNELNKRKKVLQKELAEIEGRLQTIKNNDPRTFIKT